MSTPAETSKGRRTRDAILARGVALACRVGLGGLTIGSLASEVGMSKSGMYAHFLSKKALQLAVSNGTEAQHNSWDGSHFVTTRIAATRAYEEAGISDPRAQLSLIEVHDCFSVTELVTMEDLHVSPQGGGIRDVMDGFYDADGALPCQIDGGLKCFGHPIGASGLRMAYEMYLQLQGRAGDRQRPDVRLGLTHNLGGTPSSNVACVAVFGLLQ